MEKHRKFLLFIIILLTSLAILSNLSNVSIAHAWYGSWVVASEWTLSMNWIIGGVPVEEAEPEPTAVIYLHAVVVASAVCAVAGVTCAIYYYIRRRRGMRAPIGGKLESLRTT